MIASRPVARRSKTRRLVAYGACVAAIAAVPAAAQTLSAAPIVGELVCRIGEGSIVVGNDRALLCLFDRRGQTVERYEGLTGIVTAPVARLGAAQSVTYSVAMPDPDALAALAGDYDGRGFARSGGSDALVGGKNGDVVLRPIDNRATTDLAPLNDVLGLSQLHLNYAGRVPTTGRRPARHASDR